MVAGLTYRVKGHRPSTLYRAVSPLKDGDILKQKSLFVPTPRD
jgi:hypothetical protein